MKRSKPSWLGIGAQRSGTTWLVDLLLQHPEMSLNLRNRKELHYFDRFGIEEWRSRDALQYRRMFGARGGEFTPSYMRNPWIPELVRKTCGDALILVILRDPIDRFASAMRWFDHLRASVAKPVDSDWVRDKGADAAWGGMYADQLSLWAGLRVEVIQYEAMRENPIRHVTRVWAQLGLDPIEIPDVATPTATATNTSYQWPPGLKESLLKLYATQMTRLVDEWAIDLRLWPSFAGPSN